MNQFWSLVGYEYKKLLCKKSVILAGVLAFAISIFSCFTMVIGSSNGQGNHYMENTSNYQAMLLDKSYEQALAGRELDTELILEASRAYQKVDINVPTYGKTESYQKYGRPYRCIYYLVDSAYASSGSAFNVQD
ncbi:MAG: ABC transporter permease, partial [Cellulosilyticaceae bacterium]